jgi:hypothetical protein
MKTIMQKCATCEGEGLVKIDILGETHTLDTDKVWCDEAQEYLDLKIETCPDCLGEGEIDVTEDYYLNKADDFIKEQKER